MKTEKRVHVFLVWFLVMQLVMPASSAWALPTDGSTLALDRVPSGGSQTLDALQSSNPFTGAAKQSIPISLPPGTGGMTPKLTLVYSSSGDLDSWVGSRWALGLPSIARSLKRGVPSYDDAVDTFALSGQELVPENSNPTLPRTYHTRRESFVRIVHEADDTWTVARKDGIVMRFGLASDARVENGLGGAFQWMFSEQEDPYGNVITASYDRRDPGTAYLSEIRYTLRRVGSTLQSLDGDPDRDRVVSFTLEERDDAPVSYAAGFARKLGHRLDLIDVAIGPDLLRRYDLGYTASADTFRSLLSQVELFGSDGRDLTPTAPFVTSFTYHSNVAAGTTGWSQSSWTWPSGISLVSGSRKDSGVRLGDVDGDGLVDLIKAFADVDLYTPVATLSSDSGVYLNTGSGFSTTPSTVWTIPTYPGEESLNAPFFAMEFTTSTGWIWGTGRIPIDVTGDGRVDIVAGNISLDPVGGGLTTIPSFRYMWYESSPTGWQESPDPDQDPDFFPFTDDFYATAKLGLRGDLVDYLVLGGNTRFADLTGDGLPDLMVRSADNWYYFNGYDFSCLGNGLALSYVAYNRGDFHFEHPTAYWKTVPSPGPGFPSTPDCNADFLYTPNDFFPCDPGTDGTCYQRSYHTRSYPLYNYPPDLFWYDSHFEQGNTPIDINADGLADIVTSWQDGSSDIRATQINDGDRGYFSESAWNLNSAADFYTKGSSDLFSTDRGTRLADVNGDGRVDVVFARSGSTNQTWLNDGDVSQTGDPGPWVSNSAWASPVKIVTSDGLDRGVRFVDVNGDGMVDIIRSEGTTNQVYLNRGSVPDLLIETTSSLGATTSFSYTPSTAFDNTGGDAPDLPQVIQAVTSISVDDANGNASTTTFDYEGGLFDVDEREFRGFREVIVTREGDGATPGLYQRTETTYHQGIACAGLKEVVEVYGEGDVHLSGTEYEYTNDCGGSAPYVSLVEHVTRKEYDGQATPRYSKTTTQYDGGGTITLGNVTAVIQYGEVDASGADVLAADTRTTTFDYVLPANPESADPYLVDRVGSKKLRSGAAPGAGTVLRRTEFFYDGDTDHSTPPSRGLLTRRVNRDLDGNPLTLNPETTYGYDEYGGGETREFGNLTSIRSPRANAGEFNAATTIEYETTFFTYPSAIVNEKGHRTEFQYTDSTECVAEGYSAHPPGAGLIHRASDQNVINARDAGKLSTEPARCYDVFGRIVLDRGPNNLTRTKWRYDDTPGAVWMAVDREARSGGIITSTVSYLDGLGRTVEARADDGTPDLIITESSYDPAGRLSTQTAPRFAGGPIQTTTYDYDSLDRLVARKLPGNRNEGISYVQGLVTVTDPNANETRRQIDPFGNVLWVEEDITIDGTPSTYRTNYSYYLTDQLESVTDAVGNVATVYYDGLGRKTGLDDPDTGWTAYQYDVNGNLVLLQIPSEDADGLTDITWRYDPLDRPLERVVEGETARAHWGWDFHSNGIGYLAEHNHGPNDFKAVPFARDLLGRVTWENYWTTGTGNVHRIDTTYDDIGQVATRTYPNDVTVEWVRNPRGYLTDIRQSTGEAYVSDIQWDARGRLQSWTSRGNTTTTQTFDDTTGRLDTLRIVGVNVFRDLEYAFDDGDRITGIDDSGAFNLDYGPFVYDERNRLLSATGPYGTNRAQVTLEYDYDAIGNMTCRARWSPLGACGGGTFMQYPSTPGAPRPHAPEQIGGVSVTYDPTGNLKDWGARSYTYTRVGKLKEVRDNGSLVTGMYYDGEGRLVRMTDHVTGETRHFITPDFEWNQTANRGEIRIQLAGKVVASHGTFYDPNAPSGGGSCAYVPPAGAGGLGSLLGLFMPGFAVVGVVWLRRALTRRPRRERWQPALAATTAGVFLVVTLVPYPLWTGWVEPARADTPEDKIYFYHADHLGSSLVVTDEIGNVVQDVVYFPYGGATDETGYYFVDAPEVGFTNQRFVAASDLYYYGARWYDPFLGRFFQPDDMVPELFNPQSLNRYSYVLNDPVNRIDPTGNYSMGQMLEDYEYYAGYYEEPFPQPDWSQDVDFYGHTWQDPEFFSLVPDPIIVPVYARAPSGPTPQPPPNREQPTAVPPQDIRDPRYIHSHDVEGWNSYWRWYWAEEASLKSLVSEAELELADAERSVNELEVEYRELTRGPQGLWSWISHLVIELGKPYEDPAGDAAFRGHELRRVFRELEVAKWRVGWAKETLAWYKKEVARFQSEQKSLRKQGFRGFGK